MTGSRISLRVKRLDEGLPLPRYAYDGDAGLDLLSAVDAEIRPLERMLIPTGIAVAIPAGHAGLVMPRSGLALRAGLSMANTPGLVDSGYRGELKVVAVNLDPSEPIRIRRADRIAQLVIVELPQVRLEEVGDLDETERDGRGFGSSLGSQSLERA